MTAFEKMIVMLLKNLVCDVHAYVMSSKAGYGFTDVYFEKWQELCEDEMYINKEEDDLK